MLNSCFGGCFTYHLMRYSFLIFLIKNVGAHIRIGLIRLEFSVYFPFCLHSLISGHKGVLLVSVVNLLKNHCALCCFRRLVLWKKPAEESCWFPVSRSAATATLGGKNVGKRGIGERAVTRRSDSEHTISSVSKWQILNYYITSRYPAAAGTWLPSKVFKSLLIKWHTTGSHTGHGSLGLSTNMCLTGNKIRNLLRDKTYLLNHFPF